MLLYSTLTTLSACRRNYLPTICSDTAGQDSPTELVVLQDSDLANSVAVETGPMLEDEPSAADYDPTMDMQEDKLRRDQHKLKDEMTSGAYDETTAIDQNVPLPDSIHQQSLERKNDDDFDMFAEGDDVDTSNVTRAIAQMPHENPSKAITVSQAKALDMSMLDDWDDPEGYYKVILGELLDNRYHVQSNLGKGMFSGVVRASDQKDQSLVAIKLLRNNEIM